MEVTVDEDASRKEILRLPGGFETLHLAFPTPCRPMRVFRATIEIPALPMLNPWKGIVTLTFAEQPEVGNDPAMQITLHFGRRCAGAIH
jgi:hypothetical protein